MSRGSPGIRRLVLGALAFAILAAIANSNDENQEFPEILTSIGLSLPTPRDFTVRTTRKWGRWPHEGSQWTVTASSGANALRVQAFGGLNPDAAQKKEELESSRIRFLFAGDIGYPGMVTRELKVPASLSPEVIDRQGADGRIMLLPASASLTYGVGSEDLVAYRAVLRFLYCPKEGRLFEVEWFAPKALYRRQTSLDNIRRFSCR